MAALIIIDESGDLGKRGSNFFVMVAVVTGRSRHLLGASKKIPNLNFETKFSNSFYEDKISVLEEISRSDAEITYVVVDKKNYSSLFSNCYGNDLYKNVLKQLFKETMSVISQRDVNIIIDESRSIKMADLKELANVVAANEKINVKKCQKGSSEANKCIQVADFVAGSIWTKYEKKDDEFFKIIEENIHCPYVIKATIR